MNGNREMKDLRAKLTSEGYELLKTGGGHWRITRSDMRTPVYAADTPSDRRALLNTITQIRRASTGERRAA